MTTKLQIERKDKCPCGSGKEYRKCHTPYRDKSDDNIWKGPGYPQTVYFGHKEPLTGIYFEKDRKGEFVLLRDQDRVPVGRYFCVDESILSCKAIVRLLSLSLENDSIIYAGSLEIKGKPNGTVPIIIGCIDGDFVERFDADHSGRPVTYERGNWVVFIGEDDNPIARIKNTPQWFYFLKASGYLIEFNPPGDINFRLSLPAKGFNLFTLALPFAEIELPHPQLSLGGSPMASQIEIENANISWDLVLHQEAFSENHRTRNDSKIALAAVTGNDVRYDGFDTTVRKYFTRPVKVRIGLSLPNESATIGKFSAILESIIRSISENGGFNFFRGANDKTILEADFRDHVLTILKSAKHFAYAEPARRGGFVDILIRDARSEGIIEFKVWGRRRHKEIINQVLGYGTAWTTEFATVTINPNSESIADKFITNAKTSAGFKSISAFEQSPAPVERLVSCHYLPNWGKSIVITHYIVNLQRLK
jgi:hypothetical protein